MYFLHRYEKIHKDQSCRGGNSKQKMLKTFSAAINPYWVTSIWVRAYHSVRLQGHYSIITYIPVCRCYYQAWVQVHFLYSSPSTITWWCHKSKYKYSVVQLNSSPSASTFVLVVFRECLKYTRYSSTSKPNTWYWCSVNITLSELLWAKKCVLAWHKFLSLCCTNPFLSEGLLLGKPVNE